MFYGVPEVRKRHRFTNAVHLYTILRVLKLCFPALFDKNKPTYLLKMSKQTFALLGFRRPVEMRRNQVVQFFGRRPTPEPSFQKLAKCRRLDGKQLGHRKLARKRFIIKIHRHSRLFPTPMPTASLADSIDDQETPEQPHHHWPNSKGPNLEEGWPKAHNQMKI